MWKKSSKKAIAIFIMIAFIIVIPSTVFAYNSYNYNKYFNAGEKDILDAKYDSAILNFNTALKYNKKSNDKIKEQLTLIEGLRAEEKSYESGLKLFEEKKYAEAIEAFNKVQNNNGKYFNLAQEKVKECKTIYISENLENAAKEAENKNFNEAIKLLDAILSLDSTNKDALKLKEDYNLAIKKDGEKLLAEKSAAEKKSNESAVAVNNTQKPSTKSTTTNTNSPTTTETNQSNNITISPANGGGFSIKDGDASGFVGFRNIMYNPQPTGLQYSVVSFPFDAVPYSATFYLNGREVTVNGKSNEGTRSMDISGEEVPYKANIKITITITYKGKTYTNTFYNMINS